MAEAGGGSSGQTGAGGLPHVASSADSVGWMAPRKWLQCGKRPKPNWLLLRGCLWVLPADRPTARAAAVVAVLCGMEWCLCHVEVALTNPNGASDGRTRFGPCGGRARAHRRKGGEGKRREAVGWVRMSMGGRGNGGWERGAPLGGEITLVAENGQATLRWGKEEEAKGEWIN